MKESWTAWFHVTFINISVYKNRLSAFKRHAEEQESQQEEDCLEKLETGSWRVHPELHQPEQSSPTGFICVLVSFCQRHGIAVLLVLLLCASLFLVYNGSFYSASREANETRSRPNEQLRRPTEAPTTVAKPHPPVLQGYSGIIDHKVSRWGFSTNEGNGWMKSLQCAKSLWVKLISNLLETNFFVCFIAHMQLSFCPEALCGHCSLAREPPLCHLSQFKLAAFRHTQYPPVTTNNSLGYKWNPWLQPIHPNW